MKAVTHWQQGNAAFIGRLNLASVYDFHISPEHIRQGVGFMFMHTVRP